MTSMPGSFGIKRSLHHEDLLSVSKTKHGPIGAGALEKASRPKRQRTLTWPWPTEHEAWVAAPAVAITGDGSPSLLSLGASCPATAALERFARKKGSGLRPRDNRDRDFAEEGGSAGSHRSWPTFEGNEEASSPRLIEDCPEPLHGVSMTSSGMPSASDVPGSIDPDPESYTPPANPARKTSASGPALSLPSPVPYFPLESRRELSAKKISPVHHITEALARM